MKRDAPNRCPGSGMPALMPRPQKMVPGHMAGYCSTCGVFRLLPLTNRHMPHRFWRPDTTRPNGLPKRKGEV